MILLSLVSLCVRVDRFENWSRVHYRLELGDPRDLRYPWDPLQLHAVIVFKFSGFISVVPKPLAALRFYGPRPALTD